MSGGSLPPQARPEPTITFRDRYEFELGGLRFELISTPGGETTDSMVVWLPQHRICFSGNLFGALFGHIPALITIRGDRYRFRVRLEGPPAEPQDAPPGFKGGLAPW